jgi:hypothetical protein
VVKTRQQELINDMKRNTDSQFFGNLTEYLELRISLQKDSMVSSVDMEEVKRIQGRVLEMQELLKALTRKPVKSTQYTGSFN